MIHATNHSFLVGVVGIIRDEEDRILVLDHPFRTPFRWGLPGGFINHGETLTAALEREIFEEVGLTIVVDPNIVDTDLAIRARYVSITLAARAEQPESLDLMRSNEIAAGGFFHENELPEEIYPHHRTIISRFLSG